MTLPVTPEISQALRDIAKDYVIMKCRYQSALREVRTKLEILDDEFQMRHSRNPIHHMESRIKSPQSIAHASIGSSRCGFPSCCPFRRCWGPTS